MFKRTQSMGWGALSAVAPETWAPPSLQARDSDLVLRMAETGVGEESI